MITLDDLRAICPHSAPGMLSVYLEPLNAAMDEFGISENVLRETAFLAQLAHESAGFQYVRELASGAAYEGRKDLGNTEPGDGRTFKGRGLIQITGRANYGACSVALCGYPSRLLTNPELLEEPELACRSAAWYWQTHGCNELADVGDFLRVTKRINGGTNGLADRLAYFERAKEALA